jgi:hypothetical protein
MTAARRWFLAVLAVCVVLACTYAWFILYPRPIRSVSARPPATPTPEQLLTLDFDLAATRTEDAVSLSVPPRRRLALRLVNHAPAAAYAWSLVSPYFRSGVLVLPRSRRLEYAGPPGSAECAPLQALGRALLQTSDEDQVEVRRRELEAALAEPGYSKCGAFLGFVKSTLTQPYDDTISQGIGLPPGAESLLTIEKRDPETGTALRTWRVRFRATGKDEGWTFPNEESWIIGQTASDIASMVLASDGRPPQGLAVEDRGQAGKHVISVDARGRTAVDGLQVDPSPFVWSPKAYVPLAYALIQTRSAHASPAPTMRANPRAASLLATLANLDAGVLVTENERISKLLVRDPMDASVQEQAALLLAAFALRESAGALSDYRRGLNGMAAHLAVAMALRGDGPLSLDGQIADVALEALAMRAGPALKGLARLVPTSGTPQEKQAVEAWRRALAMRLTDDWRMFKNREGATNIEKLGYLRATTRALGDVRGLQALSGLKTTQDAQWLRPLSLPHISVETGNTLGPSLLPLELAEAATILKPTEGLSSHAEQIARAVADAEARPARFDPLRPLEVLSPGLWARQAERHIASAVRINDLSLRNLGTPESAMEFRKEMAVLSRLPLVEAAVWEGTFTQTMDTYRAKGGLDKGYKEAAICGRLARELQKHPDAMPVVFWGGLARVCRAVALSGELPLWDKWFAPAVPRGTGYEVEERLAVGDVRARYSIEDLEELRALTHYSYWLLTAYVARKNGRELTGADFASAYASVAEYNLNALRTWAWLARDDDREYPRLLARACGLDPDECSTLGWVLAVRDRGDEARLAFERAVSHAGNRVGVSQNVNWLVDYYLDHGNSKRSTEIAQMAADVYSGGGLASMGRLQERLGKLDEAERYYKAILDRYQSGVDLQSFYIRQQMRSGKGRYQVEADAALHTLFPSGLEHVLLSDFERNRRVPQSFAAEEGIPVSAGDLWEVPRRFGIRENDRIVALGGYRVRSWDQWSCVRSLTDEPRTTAIVWRGNGYVQISGVLKRSRYDLAPGVKPNQWTPKTPSQRKPGDSTL